MPSIPLPGSLPPSLKEEQVSIKLEPPLKEELFKERPSFQQGSGDAKQEASEKEEETPPWHAGHNRQLAVFEQL